jgi:acyl carrier protein phosphodiesterase
MNYLAHLHLSFGDDQIMVGNLLADYVIGRNLPIYLPEKIIQGIRLHRFIDTYTDSHDVIKQGKRRIYAKQGKYSPVAVDIYYDYLLAKLWDEYNDFPLDQFAPNAYIALSQYQQLFPPVAWKRLEGMITHNWLLGYGSPEGLAYVFKHMAKKAKFENTLADAVPNLLEFETEFINDFRLFYPEMMREAKLFLDK